MNTEHTKAGALTTMTSGITKTKEEISVIWYLVWGLIMGIIGASMAEKRNRSTVGGFFIGFFLSLVGLAIIALIGEK